MAKLTIRGGDLDLVEYEFSPFNVGEKIVTLGIDCEKKPVPMDGTFTATVPARIHLTVLDMNRFAPDRPGGGGIGFAIKLYTSAIVKCHDTDVTVDYGREPVIRHFVEVFKEATGYTGGFSITVTDHERKHVGLGSTGNVLLAVGHAMNAAVDYPLDAEEIRLLIGHNYVEETCDGRIIHGFETGVGPAAATYGGMAVLGDELSLVCHHSFAADKNVFVIIPPTEAKASGEDEFNILMNRARCLDYRDRELKSYMVLMDLVPALVRDDLEKLGEVIGEIDFRGSKRAEVEHNSFEIYHYMSRLKEAGLEFVGMSSVGPSIAVITKKSPVEMEIIAEKLGLVVEIVTTVDNVGVKIIRG